MNAATCSWTRADDLGGGVADGDDGDARAEVDQGVAVDVDEDAAAGRLDEHRQHVADPVGDEGLLPGEAGGRLGAGDLGDEATLLGERGTTGRGRACWDMSGRLVRPVGPRPARALRGRSAGRTSSGRVTRMGDYRATYDRSLRDPEGFWREQADARRLDQEARPGPRREPRALLPLVPRRHPQHLLQRARPARRARARRADGPDLRLGVLRRAAALHLRRAARTRSRRSPVRCSSWASARATGSSSTCR